MRVSRAETSVLLFGVGDVWAFFVKYSEVAMFPQLIRVFKRFGFAHLGEGQERKGNVFDTWDLEL